MKGSKSGNKLTSENSEQWRGIKGIDPHYRISSLGRVRFTGKTMTRTNGSTCTYKPRIRKTQRRKDGYLQIRLPGVNGKTKNYLVHRLVARAFIPNPLNKPEVNHKDNNPENNKADNLEWTTTKENTQHAHDNGHVKSVKGESHADAKLTEKIVRIIRKWAETSNEYEQFTKRIREKYKIKITPTAVRSACIRKTWKHVI